MSDLVDRARAALARHLAANPYPGRGLVVGRAEDGGWLQVYWIMGRSAGSRNRVFVADGPTLATRPWDDGASVGDGSLTLYEAMLELPGVYLVTNGDQTRTAADALAAGQSFEAALATREREHDAPNYTPRISGLLDFRGPEPAVALSILKANPADPERTDRFGYRPAPLPPGLGHALTTYQGDGQPLPPFEGEPLVLPLEGPPEAVLEAYWDALDADNRVSLAVKAIPAAGDGPGHLWVQNRHS